MTIKEALGFATKKFHTISDSPQLDAEVLLMHVLKKPHDYLITHAEKNLTNLQTTTYKQLTRKRASHHPIAYLTGHKEFYGLDFTITQDVLIPRPESELLVELTLKKLQATTYQPPPNIIDIGTGSGCLIISLAKQLTEYDRITYHTLRFYGTDISKKALAVAHQNARRHKVLPKIQFLHGDLLEPFLQATHYNLVPSIIIANLPYLTSKQLQEPSIQKEPRKALYGGTNGLKYYEKLFKQINTLQRVHSSHGTNKKKIHIILEYDPHQKKLLLLLAKKYFPQTKLKFHTDLAHQDRVLEIQI